MVYTRNATIFIPTQDESCSVFAYAKSGVLCISMGNIGYSGSSLKDNDIVLAHGKDISESDGIGFAAVGNGIVDYDLFLELLKKHNYSDDIILHGIYQEKLMNGCFEFMKRKTVEHGC